MNYPVQIIFTLSTKTYELTIPDLPGCKSASENIDIAMKMLHAQIAEHLTILVEYGELVPVAKTMEFHFANKLECSADEKVMWAFIEFDILPYLGKSHKINVTLPELLIKQIDDRVNKSEQYKTRSGFIAHACANELI